MFNKVYEYIKKILKGNYKSIVFILCFLIVATYVNKIEDLYKNYG